MGEGLPIAELSRTKGLDVLFFFCRGGGRLGKELDRTLLSQCLCCADVSACVEEQSPDSQQSEAFLYFPFMYMLLIMEQMSLSESV